MMATTSNNDVEGWHHGLHRQTELKLIPPNRPTSPRGLINRSPPCFQEKTYKNAAEKVQVHAGKIFELWEDYQQNRRSAEQLLWQCAHSNGPKRLN